ncbi:NAD(P)-binding protein [Wolfiporia cocos MD-104 SS10]|uniref:NAD(P)-binding protein n=1 Tax=Wolfiporia cocos (strain MD-104) TaxID=742152 RepID=A0A2H3JPP6_WOLCO|nr:NAD(P)-binding protein [Wolfiporia cocos MD-104 SS10]
MVEGNSKYAVKNLFNVEGWVAVVTGGGTGIGLMIAQAFANNGARVYITGRRADALQTAAKTWGANLLHPQGKIIPVTADITDKASIQNLAVEISKHEKQVDVLVNNAGIDGDNSTVEKGDESVSALQRELWKEDVSMWEDVYRTNVIGYFFTTVAFLPLLSATSFRTGHSGSVINISSISGITRTSQHHMAYNSSKAAVIQLNRLLAQELRRPGVKVRVNSIAPGIFPSEMTTEGSNEQNKSTIPVDEEYGKKKGIPAGRSGGEEDMAQAALLLACNQYIYGETLTVDGGYLLEHP